MRGPPPPIISGGVRAGGGRSSASSRRPNRPSKRHALAGEQPPDLLERLLEARDAQVERQAERSELLVVPARAERDP